MGIGVVRVDGEDGVGLIGSLTRLLACDKNISEVDACLKIARLKVDGAQQLPVGGHDRSLLEKDLGELIVSLSEVMVDLEGVGELDGRFLEFALVGISFAAFKVPLLLLVGIAMTTHSETKCKRYSQDC